MKRKIIALLLAAVSVSSLLVGCKEKEKEACAAHADTNKDAVCDACGKDVVIVTEQLPAEKEPVVEMVVNPIGGGSLSDYLNTAVEAPKYVPSNGVEKVENYLSVSSDGTVYFLKESQSFGSNVTDTYTLYNAVKDSDIYTFTTSYSTHTDSYYWGSCEVSFTAAYIKVTEKEDGETTYKFLDYNGKTIVRKEGSSEEATSSYNSTFTRGDYGVHYFTIGDTKYAMNAETYEILHQADGDMFINRPMFDKVVENYGYVGSGNSIYVYDLNEWIECVYVAEAPSYWTDAKAFVLDNGKILTQASVRLPDDAVNYDYLTEDSERKTAKYDIVYMVTDPSTGTQTNVEFGYMITGEADKDAYTENALNVFTVNPVKNRRIDENQTLTLVTDNDMNVLYSYKAVALGQNESKMQLVADGLFLSEIVYGDGTTADIIVNEAGGITYLPRNYQVSGGFVLAGGKAYDWQMNLKLDLEENDYKVYDSNEAGLFLTKYDGEEGTTDYYFYAPSMNAPKHIGNSEEVSNVSVLGSGFVVVSYDEIEEVNVYSYYNNNCKRIANFSYNVVSVMELGESGVYLIRLADNSVYFAR